MPFPHFLLLVMFALIGSPIKADKSPNPAAISYSGCNLKQALNCNSHSDSDIQMGECWSNTRVMQQQSAFFVPYPPGHKSFDSEGGPYGECTAYACFPSPSDMQEEKNLANFCFFWDGKDHTTISNGGLQRRGLTEDSQRSSTTADPNQNTTETIDPISNTANDPKNSTNAADPNICAAPNPNTKPTTGKEPSLDPKLNNGTESGTKSKNNHKHNPTKTKHMKKTKKIKSEKKSPSSSDSSDKDYSNNNSNSTYSTSKASGSNSDSGSQSSTNSSMPTAPGQVVIPIPMICPSNLPDCYSADYFEEGGKLQVYANLVPTYQGLWFPPKNQNHEYTFCKGLDLGCSAPTMRNLQSKNIGKQDCDISKCKVPANST